MSPRPVLTSPLEPLKAACWGLLGTGSAIVGADPRGTRLPFPSFWEITALGGLSSRSGSRRVACETGCPSRVMCALRPQVVLPPSWVVAARAAPPGEARQACWRERAPGVQEPSGVRRRPSACPGTTPWPMSWGPRLRARHLVCASHVLGRLAASAARAGSRHAVGPAGCWRVPTRGDGPLLDLLG